MIHSFHLGVHLGVICSQEVLFNAEDIADVMGELACKLWALIRYDLLWDPEEIEDLFLVNVHEL